MIFNSTKKECKANKREGENPNFILLHLNPSYPQTTVCFMPLPFSLSAHHAAVFMSLSFSPYCLENAFSRNWNQRHEGEGSTSHLHICPSYLNHYNNLQYVFLSLSYSIISPTMNL